MNNGMLKNATFFLFDLYKVRPARAKKRIKEYVLRVVKVKIHAGVIHTRSPQYVMPKVFAFPFFVICIKRNIERRPRSGPKRNKKDCGSTIINRYMNISKILSCQKLFSPCCTS